VGAQDLQPVAVAAAERAPGRGQPGVEQAAEPDQEAGLAGDLAEVADAELLDAQRQERRADVPGQRAEAEAEEERKEATRPGAQ
jgi:hypothetical protein